MPKSFQITLAAQGVIISAVLYLILTLFLGFIYYFTSLPESGYFSLIITGLSVLPAAFYICYRSGSRGLLYGLTIGLGFFLLSFVIYLIFYQNNSTMIIIAEKLFVSLLAGGLGGILGAILKR